MNVPTLLLETFEMNHWLLGFAILCCGASAYGQHGSQATYTAEELKTHFQNEMDAYEIVSGGRALELQSQPLMNWSNSERKQEQGALYSWNLNGRPQTLISIFTYQHENQVFCRHELLSLSEKPLVARLDGALAWSPRKPGVQWVSISDLPPPAGSPSRRLIQMRGIARQFSGELRMPEGKKSNLTLLPQPVLRYETKEDGVIDGAVFSFAVGTDPEIWLLVEAVETSSGRPSWRYSPARSHYHELVLRRKDRVVWSVPLVDELKMTRQAQQPFSSAPYFLFHPNQAIPRPEVLQ